jgi:hypothetical protein
VSFVITSYTALKTLYTARKTAKMNYSHFQHFYIYVEVFAGLPVHCQVLVSLLKLLRKLLTAKLTAKENCYLAVQIGK